MEIFDLLETQVVAMLKEIVFLREENTVLKFTVANIEDLKEENRVLKESLNNEQMLRKNISTRVDTLLAMVGEHIS